MGRAMVPASAVPLGHSAAWRGRAAGLRRNGTRWKRVIHNVHRDRHEGAVVHPHHVAALADAHVDVLLIVALGLASALRDLEGEAGLRRRLSLVIRHGDS